jgi:exosortase
MVLACAAFRMPLYALANLAFRDEHYSHIVLIPFLSACLVYANRKQVFRESRFYPAVGLPLLATGLAAYSVIRAVSSPFREASGLSMVVFAIVLVWIAGFVFCYGPQSFSAALFPLFFLAFMIPVPPGLLSKAVAGLQAGSAGATDLLFRMLHVPVLREGYRFTVPHFTIEIAQQCSSIRSSTALLITGVLAGHFFLRSNTRRICLALITVLIAIFTNAVRIVTLTCLAAYVNPGFLFGRLHRSGGAAFSLLSVSILLCLLALLRRSEAHGKDECAAGSL